PESDRFRRAPRVLHVEIVPVLRFVGPNQGLSGDGDDRDPERHRRQVAQSTAGAIRTKRPLRDRRVGIEYEPLSASRDSKRLSAKPQRALLGALKARRTRGIRARGGPSDVSAPRNRGL